MKLSFVTHVLPTFQQAGHYKNRLAHLVKSIDLKQVSKANYLHAKLYCLFN